jgi:ubiquinone/menaquinone biosynthesis C-methylase UbiE
MDRKQVKAAWENAATEYARIREAGGADAALVRDLVDSLDGTPTVLDIGCGDGMRTLANMTGATAVGIDVARTQVEMAAANVPAAHLLQGDMLAIPIADNSVDAITAYHAVFHVDRDQHPAVYREFARVLRPGGRVLLTVGSTAYEQVRSDWLGTGHEMFFSTPGQRETVRQLEAAGFDIRWQRRVEDPLGSTVPFVLAELSE